VFDPALQADLLARLAEAPAVAETLKQTGAPCGSFPWAGATGSEVSAQHGV
jgi:hypothetical protein